ncbi:NAD-dependent epimerase/dehydratase family protein [Pelotomaculum propionicicum]|uniref:NAD-dependent epimerase/dehydratase family protein n=1 Tax=Pelotomaculum propionicicum TaxID=258475 RepID=UPI003B79A2B1
MRLKDRNVLVTGGAGFLGSLLCETLVAEGAGVSVIDDCGADRATNLEKISHKIEFCRGTIADEGQVCRAAVSADTIVHLAFPMALRQRALDTALIAENLAGVCNLIKAALKRNALLVYVSSIGVYGNGRYNPIDEDHPLEPVLIHGAVKLAGENLCRAMARGSGLRCVILRVADIYGPRNSRLSVPIKFLLQAVSGRPLTVHGDGSDSRTYTYAADFAEAVVLSISRPEAENGVFNVAGDDCVSMSELAREVIRVTGSNSPVLHLDAPCSGRRLFIDNCKSKKMMGFKPRYSIAAGLDATCAWLRENPGFYSNLGNNI